MTKYSKTSAAQTPGGAGQDMEMYRRHLTLLRHRTAALAPFADPWRLLNATPTDLRLALDGFYELEDLAALGTLLEALRVQFRQRAKQERRDAMLSTITVDLNTLGMEADPRELLRRMIAVTTPEIAQSDLSYDPTPPMLITHLAPPIFTLLWLLQGANPSNVYSCEQCGWIGYSRRTDKRFCGNVCRLRWERDQRGIRVERSDSLARQRRRRSSEQVPAAQDGTEDRAEEEAEGDEPLFPEDVHS